MESKGRLLSTPNKRYVNDLSARNKKLRAEEHRVSCYSVPEAAKALGRTPLTLKSWIASEMVPPPILADTTYGYMQYSKAELQSIAKVLHKHEKVFSYLLKTHTDTVNDIYRAVDSCRGDGKHLK